MTNIKKLVAVLLAVMMIAGSVSVLGYADETGNNLKIRTEFGKVVNNVWQEVTDVNPGDDVSVRIYLESDFNSTFAQMLFFYDKDFFSDSYEGFDPLTVGATYAAAPYKYSAEVNTDTTAPSKITKLVKRGVIDQETADNSGMFFITALGASSKAAPFVDDDFLVQVDLHVLDTATGSGDIFFLPKTVLAPTNSENGSVYGQFIVNRGEYGAYTDDCEDCISWQLNVDKVEANDTVNIMENPVNVTFDANGGAWGDQLTVQSTGSAGSELSVPENPVRMGYEFIGWASAPNATQADLPANYPDDSAIYYAVWQAKSAGGDKVDITTKFFRQVDGEWVPTERVRRGETVKARVYLATEYFANHGELLFFYDNDFFTESYGEEEAVLTVNTNPDSFTANKGVYGYFYTAESTSHKADTLVDNGYIDKDFLEQNDFFWVSYSYSKTDDTNAIIYDDAEGLVDGNVDDDLWFCEFELTVADSATGEGDLFVEENTIIDPEEHYYAAVNIPMGSEGESDHYGMWLWWADVNLYSTPVSLGSTLTFDPNGGSLVVDGTTYTTDDPYITEGEIGTAINTAAIVDPEWTGHVFMGWADENDEIVDVPSAFPYEDAVYTAKWNDKVTLSFETYGGTEIDNIEGAAGTPFNAEIANPEKEGYTFIGWSATPGVPAEGETQAASGLAPIVGLPEVFPEFSNTYYAVYSENIYDVNYYVIDPNGKAELVASLPVAFGDSIATDITTAYDAPDGFALNGWFFDVTGDELVPAGSKMPAESIDLYGWLTYADAVATFDANGGTFSDGTSSISFDVPFMSDITAPEDPTLAGYTFMGWKPIVGMMLDPEGMTFVAAWDETVYTETFIVDGETFAIYDDLHFGSVFENPADPVKDGYTFKGWSEAENGTTTVELPATMPDNDTVYYAVFDINTYTVTYDPAEGTLTVGTDTYDVTSPYTADYEFDAAIADVGEADAADYYEFVKWNWYNVDEEGAYTDLDEEDKPIAIEAPETMPANNLKAVAEYAPRTYVATFDANGGAWGDETVFTEDVVYDELIASPDAAPEKDGYEFKGYTNFTDGETKMIPASADDEGMTFTAVWEAKPYTVTYLTDGGKLTVEEKEYTDDDPYVDTILCDEPFEFIEEKPEKAGYDFAGWDIDGDGEADTILPDQTMPAEDVTATPVWAPADDTPFTIKYYFMNTSGEYSDTPDVVDDTNFGTTLTKVAVVPAPLKESDFTNLVDKVIVPDTVEGFTFDNSKDNVLSGTIAADGSLVLKVYYSRNTYTVTFDADGGYIDGDESAAVKSEVMYYGAEIIAPTTVEKTGYTLADPAWAPEVDETVPAEDVTYVAQWVANEHTISFNAGEGTFPGVDDDPETAVDETKVNEITADFGDPLEAPEDPELPGYDFVGWDLDGDGEVAEDETLPETVPDENIEAEAVFAPKQYNVTFDANTGAFDDGEAVKVVPEDYESAITAPGTPVKEGYEFLGWAADPAAETALNDLGTVPMNDDTVLYAVYKAEEHSYKIVVHTMGTDGTYTDKEFSYTADTDTVIELEAYELSDTVSQIVLAGTTEVVGGSFKPNDTALNTTDSVMSGVVTADDALVLDIYLDRQLHTVTYNYSYGPIDLTEEQEYYNGAAIEEFTPDEIEGYTFDGWYADADCKEEAEIPALMGSEDIEVFGKYVINEYTVTYDAGDGAFDDGSSEKEVKGPFGQTVIAPEDPTREGYTFKGWTYTDDEGETEAPTTFPSKNIDAAAEWEINSYNFTALNGEEPFATGSYDFGAEVSIVGTPEKKGYLFDGWTDEDGNKVDVPFDMPAEDVTLYAAFTPDKVNYTVKSHYINANTGSEVTGIITTDSALTDSAVYIVDEAGTEEGATYVLFSDLPATVATNYALDKENAANVLTGTVAPDGSLVLDVWYTAVKYPVTFNANGGAFEGIDGDAVKEYTYASYVEDPADLVPVRDGYTAAGWSLSDDNNAENAVDFSAQGPETKVMNANKVFYVIWVANDSPVTFDAGEGTFTKGDPTDNKVVLETKTGDPYNAPSDPVREGYEFGGWTVDGEDAEFPAVAGSEPVTYEPKWIPTENNTVTWDANGGFFDDDASTDYDEEKDSKQKIDENIVFDSEVTAPDTDPIRDGYHFVGWASDAEALVPDTELKADSTDKTFYAVWTGNNGVGYYLYIYEMGVDGTYPDEPSDIIEYADGVTGEERFLTFTPQSGFTLDTTTSDGTPASVLNGRIPEEGKLILKAYLIRDQFNFTAMTEDGSETVEGPTGYYYGEAVAAPEAPDKAGYDFVGWTTEKGDETKLVTFPTVMPAEDVVVYALYEKHEYTVTFDAGEGSFTKDDPTDTVRTVPAEMGDEITAPTDDPIRDGYEFKGWAVEGDETETPVEFPVEVGSEDVTYVPIWEEISFKVTYFIPVRDDVDGSETYGKLSAVDTVYSEENVPFGEAIPQVDDPEILYYEFLGWSLTADNDPATVLDSTEGTMPAQNVDYYAVFKRIPVYLIPKDGSTTQIDRGDGFYGDGSSYEGILRDGTINAVSDTAYTPWSADSENVWYVYGLCDRITDALLHSTYCDVNGDGYFVVTPEKEPSVPTVTTPIGTASTITVYDKVTGEVVETFKIVVFGDITGDGAIRSGDNSAMAEENTYLTGWSDIYEDDFDSAKFMAGDLQRDFFIFSSDLSIERGLVGMTCEVDQVTGKVTYY